MANRISSVLGAGRASPGRQCSQGSKGHARLAKKQGRKRRLSRVGEICTAGAGQGRGRMLGGGIQGGPRRVGLGQATQMNGAAFL